MDTIQYTCKYYLAKKTQIGKSQEKEWNSCKLSKGYNNALFFSVLTIDSNEWWVYIYIYIPWWLSIIWAVLNTFAIPYEEDTVIFVDVGTDCMEVVVSVDNVSVLLVARDVRDV